MASEIRVNKIENRSGLGTVTFADTGVDLAGIVTATTFSGSGASLTNIPDSALSSVTASKLTGALPAISGANLTGIAATDNVRTGILDVAGVSTFRNTMNVGAAVTISESGIEASGIGITVANINGTQVGGRRNVIINGAMQVSQRGTSFSTVANNEITLDRFGLIHPYGSSQMSISQSTDSPDGFSKSYKLDVNTVDSSIGSGQYVVIRHRIEAQNLQQLAFGTSAAKPISLSFYVRSNKTGTFAINIQQIDNSSKQVSAPYTISSANTWERKTFTFAGDTSGVINDDNGTGLTVIWWISAGSTYNSGTSRSTFTTHADADAAVGCNVNILDSTDNNFYLTGVQLEVGSQATDFEHRSHGEEERLCQRYYFRQSAEHQYMRYACHGQTPSANGAQYVYQLPVRMRATPTLGYSQLSDFYMYAGNLQSKTPTSLAMDANSTISPMFVGAKSGTFTAGQMAHLTTPNSQQGYLEFNAEL